MSIFNRRVEELKVSFEEKRDMYDECGNRVEMWVCEGSIDACNKVLKANRKTKLEIMGFLSTIELKAQEKMLEELSTKKLYYHEGLNEAIKPLRKIADEVLD